MRCKKCNAIISSQTLNCPYCGQYNSQRKQKDEDFGNQETVNTLNVVNMKKNYFSCFVGVLTVFCILCIGSIVIYSHFINGYKGTIEKQVKPIEVYREESYITLEQVLELSKKGQGLSWSDFDNFVCEEERYNKFTGEQSRIYRSHLNYTFSILISGQRGSRPKKILLMPKVGGYNNNVDLRNTEEVKKFIEKNKSGLIWK